MRGRMGPYKIDIFARLRVEATGTKNVVNTAQSIVSTQQKQPESCETQFKSIV